MKLSHIYLLAFSILGITFVAKSAFMPPGIGSHWLTNYISSFLPKVLFSTSTSKHRELDVFYNSRYGTFESAAISTGSAVCAEVGRDMLLKNGTAVDAAIAVLLCMGVVSPENSGLGGGFHMVIYNRKEKRTYVIDSKEVAPMRAHRDMFGSNASTALHGGRSIAVPSELIGFSYIHKRFGVLPWKELFIPAIKIAKKGFKVKKHLSRALRLMEGGIIKYEHIRNIFINKTTGQVYKNGDIIKRPDLARTLSIISQQGPDALYATGQLAKDFLNDLKAAGSIIERDDLLNYKPRMREPVKTVFRKTLTLHASGLPTGGILIALILNVMDQYKDINPDTPTTKNGTVKIIHRLLETFKFAFAQRRNIEDNDSSEMTEFIKKLTSKRYAEEIYERIDDERTYNSVAHYDGDVDIGNEDHGTSHVAIVAPNGDAVSVTTSIDQFFGSMVLSPSTGILLNNQMDDFCSPNITNSYQVPPSGKNTIKPGKRPLSSMSPCIVTDTNGDVRMVIGASGGTRIISRVIEVIFSYFWLNVDLKLAMDSPQFHHQLWPNCIQHEDFFDIEILQMLQDLGHDVQEKDFGDVGIPMGIVREKDGSLFAYSDSRESGEVDGF